jgi:hypothetical protein
MTILACSFADAAWMGTQIMSALKKKQKMFDGFKIISMKFSFLIMVKLLFFNLFIMYIIKILIEKTNICFHNGRSIDDGKQCKSTEDCHWHDEGSHCSVRKNWIFKAVWDRGKGK